MMRWLAWMSIQYVNGLKLKDSAPPSERRRHLIDESENQMLTNFPRSRRPQSRAETFWRCFMSLLAIYGLTYNVEHTMAINNCVKAVRWSIIVASELRKKAARAHQVDWIDIHTWTLRRERDAEKRHKISVRLQSSRFFFRAEAFSAHDDDDRARSYRQFPLMINFSASHQVTASGPVDSLMNWSWMLEFFVVFYAVDASLISKVYEYSSRADELTSEKKKAFVNRIQ